MYTHTYIAPCWHLLMRLRTSVCVVACVLVVDDDLAHHVEELVGIIRQILHQIL